MIKLQDILNENLDIDKLFNNLLTKVKQSGQSTAGLENEFNKADNPVAKLKVLNKYKNIVKETINEDVEYFKPKASKDLNNPNFLTITIKYPTNPGFTTALGSRTMSGRENEEGAIKALSMANKIAQELETKYNLEDIDVSDNKNGKVTIFAVSDDFIKEKEMNEVESAFKIDPALASKIYDILEEKGVKLDMTKSYFFNFLNNKL